MTGAGEGTITSGGMGSTITGGGSSASGCSSTIGSAGMADSMAAWGCGSSIAGTDAAETGASLIEVASMASSTGGTGETPVTTGDSIMIGEG